MGTYKQQKLVNVTIFSFFSKKISFFTLKTGQNSLRLSKIMLANGADNSNLNFEVLHLTLQVTLV